MRTVDESGSQLSIAEPDFVQANREERKRIHTIARNFLQNYGSLVRQIGVHDSMNAAVRAVLDPLSQNIQALQNMGGNTTFVFAAGHSFCDGVWIRCTGRSWETANQIAGALKLVKLRGFICAPHITDEAILQFARIVRDLIRNPKNAAQMTLNDSSIPGLSFIPLEDDETDPNTRSRFRKQVFDLFDEGLRTTSTAVQARMDIFTRRRQRSLIMRLVKLAEQSPEDLLILTTLRDPTLPATSHVLMVAILSIALGSAIGLRRRDLVRLGIAALSHNVGETLLPDGLLELPRELTDGERVVLESHPIDGARYLVQRHGFDTQIAERAIASMEHHRWADGGGYPRLVEHRAHIFSRIIAVADVFDAFCQQRPFREEFPPDQAVKLVGRFSGSQLDLSLVRTLIRIVGRYPPGTLVELDSGEYAVVVGTGKGAQPLKRPRVLILTDDEGYELEEYVVVDLGERHPRRRAWLRTIMRARDSRTLNEPLSAYLLADRIELAPTLLDHEVDLTRSSGSPN
jgi:HD-GYP domain-containing protein (c-di-GMP phosphodiesterase class II)